MISKKLEEILAQELRPTGGDADLAKYLITVEQATVALTSLGIAPDSGFYAVMQACKLFPVARSCELNNLHQIMLAVALDYWGAACPGFAERYLELSAVEGGTSYFLERKTEYVFAIEWGQMNDLFEEIVPPTWTSYLDFLEWYYQE